jgi:dsDNA-specific endonuclease/ATPase MutS2
VNRAKVEHIGAALPAPDGAGPAAAGDRVEITHLGLKGDVLGVDGETVTVQAGAVTVKVPMQAVRVIQRPSQQASPTLSPRGERNAGHPLPSGERAGVRGGRPSRISTPGTSAVAVEMNT